MRKNLRNISLVLLTLLLASCYPLVGPRAIVINQSEQTLEDVQVITQDATLVLGDILPQRRAKKTIPINNDTNIRLRYQLNGETYHHNVGGYLTRGTAGSAIITVDRNQDIIFQNNLRAGF